MPDDKGVPEGFTGTLHVNNLGMLDFGESCLKLGIKTGDKPQRWMELDEDDWRILAKLLTKPLLPDGSSAADHSAPLSNLALYAQSAADWMANHP